jgi:hypothetical protein
MRRDLVNVSCLIDRQRLPNRLSAREKPRQYARTATKKIRGRIEPFETVTR